MAIYAGSFSNIFRVNYRNKYVELFLGSAKEKDFLILVATTCIFHMGFLKRTLPS